MKIDINKKYRTRDGREVRLLHRVPEGWPTSYPWRGIVGDASHLTWTDHGVQDLDDPPSDDDLIEDREPREWTLAVSVGGAAYKAGEISGQRTQDQSFSEFWVPVRVREILD